MRFPTNWSARPIGVMAHEGVQDLARIAIAQARLRMGWTKRRCS